MIDVQLIAVRFIQNYVIETTTRSVSWNSYHEDDKVHHYNENYNRPNQPSPSLHPNQIISNDVMNNLRILHNLLLLPIRRCWRHSSIHGWRGSSLPSVCDRLPVDWLLRLARISSLLSKPDHLRWIARLRLSSHPNIALWLRTVEGSIVLRGGREQGGCRT